MKRRMLLMLLIFTFTLDADSQARESTSAVDHLTEFVSDGCYDIRRPDAAVVSTSDWIRSRTALLPAAHGSERPSSCSPLLTAKDGHGFDRERRLDAGSSVVVLKTLSAVS
jgi:hypothetical protein